MIVTIVAVAQAANEIVIVDAELDGLTQVSLKQTNP